MKQLDEHRKWYAQLVLANAGISLSDERLTEAFLSVPRENFVGAGPWKIFTRSGYVETPSADPVFLYNDFAVGLKPDEKINNGQPSLHAVCLAVLHIKEGETIVHIGAGTGYYSALLSKLTGANGLVSAMEIDFDLAKRAGENLKSYPNVNVIHRSGTEGELPSCDIIYVNAGASSPLNIWLDALNIGGRLLFPLTPGFGAGGMLLVTRKAFDEFSARFVCSAMFIPCAGAQDEQMSAKLSIVFGRGDMGAVRSLKRNGLPDETCWCEGDGWWLSTTTII